MNNDIVVKSHVSRDLLQSAGLFKTDSQVVWEYVSNSLQYVDPGVSPTVTVTVDSRNKHVTIADNGRGMTAGDLQNFFIMHGENQDRKLGRAGRGNFGTGKSAAFGIAALLRITTVRNGKRSQVELSRTDLDKMHSGQPVPVKTLEREVPTAAPNGTIVEIERVHLRGFDQHAIIKYIERHLAHARRDATVIVNGHECEYAAPPVDRTIVVKASGAYAAALGPVDLVLKVSKVPLDAETRGVSIYSNGVWHESTLAGSEGKDMAQYVFGEIDVPNLEQDKSPISPFDMSRSMKLNPANELVQAIYAFVGQNVETLRRELVDAEKVRRSTEEARKLAAEASKIAEILNDDFDQFRNRFARVQAKSRGTNDSISVGELASGDLFLVAGGDVVGTLADVDVLRGGHTGPGPADEPDEQTEPLLKRDPAGNGAGSPTGMTESKKRKGGGFSVKFDSLGAQVARAKYESDSRTIFINLDHPQIVAALGGGNLEDPTFKRLAYEVAFTEYSIALAQEMAKQGLYLDATDPIVDIRDTINRLATRASEMYRAA